MESLSVEQILQDLSAADKDDVVFNDWPKGSGQERKGAFENYVMYIINYWL